MAPSSSDELRNKRFYVAVLAEFVGTLLLVLVGCFSCINYGAPWGAPTTVQIAFSFGLSVGTIVWGIANASGGHINPAVTMAMLVTRKISLVRSILYILVQCLGAVVGAAILKAIVMDIKGAGLGLTTVNTAIGVSVGQAFGVEFMVTFVLVFTVFATCDSKRKDLDGSGPLAIGLSIAMCHLGAIPLTGSSQNSARSFGPAVVEGVWTHHWVYWAGPILGGIVAGLLYDNLFAANASLDKTKAYLTTRDYDSDEFEVDPAPSTPLKSSSNGAELGNM